MRPGRPRRERAAAEPGYGRFEDLCAGLQGRIGVGEAGVARVVQVNADGDAEPFPAPRAHAPAAARDTDRVREDDLPGPRRDAALGEGKHGSGATGLRTGTQTRH